MSPEAARVIVHFEWLANSMARLVFNSKETPKRSGSALVSLGKGAWNRGFCWNGVYVKLCTLGSPEYNNAKKEFKAIRKLSKELIVSNKYVLPIMTIVKHGAEALIVTPCINPSGKKFENSSDGQLLTAKLREEDVVTVEGVQGDKYIIVRPQKLLEVDEELNCLLYVDPRESIPIEILYKVSSLRFEELTLASFLNKGGKTLSNIATAGAFAYNWHMQMCSSTLTLEPNPRLQRLFNKGRGPGLIACSYAKHSAPKVKYIVQVAEELQLKATQLGHASLKDFLHAKGVALRYAWIVVAYLSNSLAKDLLCIDILVRGVEKLIVRDVKEKSKNIEAAIVMYANGLLSKEEEVLEAIEEVLFFSKLRVMAVPINFMSEKSRSYLLSDEIVRDVVKSAAKNPASFLLALESLLSIKLDKRLIKRTREDKLLHQSLKELHIASIKPRIDTSTDPAAFSYFALSQSSHSGRSTSAVNARFVELKAPPEELWIPSPNLSGKTVAVAWLGSTQGKNALEKWANFNRRAFEGLYRYDWLLLYSKILLDVAKAKNNPGVSFNEIEKDLEEISKCEFIVPELLMFAYTMTGLCYECGGKNAEAESNYLRGLQVYLQMYGNPKGRGNHTHPWGAFLAHKLKEIAGKKVNDFNFMNELFEAIKFCTVKNNVETSKKMFSPFAEEIPLFFKSSLSQIWFSWLLYYSPMQHVSGALWSQRSLQTAAATKSQLLNSSKGKHRRTFNQYQVFSKEVEVTQKVKGAVYVWGANDQGQLAFSPGLSKAAAKKVSPCFCFPLKDKVVRKVVCGRNSSFAITVHSSVYSWGENEYSQLGLGKEAPRTVFRPARIQNFAATELASGIEHTLALTASNEVFTWGSGSGGLLGHGGGETQHSPRRLERLKDVLKVACGGLHSVVVTRRGEMFGWGRAEGGQLGLPEKVLVEAMKKNGDCFVGEPVRIEAEGEVKAVDVSCGEAHTLALDCNGKVYGWGFCNFGQLGINLTSDCFEPGTGDYKSKVNTPRLITALSHLRISKVVAGSTFSIFVTTAGEVYGCGVNDFGQTGLEMRLHKLQVFYPSPQKFVATTDVAVPLVLACFSGIRVRAVACGENHSLGVSTDPFTLWSWGKHHQGQLGLGEVAKTSEPRVISEFSSVAVASVCLLISARSHAEPTTQW